MKKLTIILALVCAVTGLYADIMASNVLVRQRWPWSRLIDVSYAVTGLPDDEVYDVELQATLGGESIEVPVSALGGERQSLPVGYHVLTIDPELVPALQGRDVSHGLRVNLVVRRPPTYIVVDLDKSLGQDGQIVPIVEDDLHAGLFGAVETNKFGLSGLAWTAVTNTADYKTTKIVFRRIPHGTVLDENGNALIVEKDFYMGVFETTYKQVRSVGYTSFTPSFQVPEAPAVNGYDLAHLIGENEDYPDDCCIVKFRQKTGLDIDLPTSVQWEYACRAGSSGTAYYDNKKDATEADCMRYAWSTSNSPVSDRPQEVGLLECNAWGLYDTLGNAYEWCADKNDTTRYRLGGSYYQHYSCSSCSYKKASGLTDGDIFKMNGFRLILRIH